MKKILIFLYITISISVFAQEKVFLVCSGSITTNKNKSETSKKEEEFKNTINVSTEIVIDKKFNSMQIQIPLINICKEDEKCDCTMNNDSYMCKDEIKYGSVTSNSYVYSSKKINISRKSGIAIFTYLYQSTISSSEYLISTTEISNGQLQCKTITKNLF